MVSRIGRNPTRPKGNKGSLSALTTLHDFSIFVYRPGRHVDSDNWWKFTLVVNVRSGDVVYRSQLSGNEAALQSWGCHGGCRAQHEEDVQKEGEARTKRCL